MKAALISGGSLDEVFTSEFLMEWKPDQIIGVDKGLLFLYQHQIQPDLIVGDFDSLPEAVLEQYQDLVPIRRFLPEKDAADTEIGIREAMNMGADQIVLLGATGTRLDHVLANIQVLMIPLKEGITAFIQDQHNRIRLLEHGMVIEKEQMFGDYVSFFPLTWEVTNLTLKGFQYPLQQHTLTSNNSLTVSNEVIAGQAVVEFEDGILIMIESRD
ncbi:MAG: thiamine diphosphokinase [Lachnospiraceae bacterium]|nr:thiamine diphosphokinase [Lachnospiraceae bacterium]